MYTCKCIHANVYMQMYTCKYTCKCIHANVYMQMYTCKCIHANVYLHASVYHVVTEYCRVPNTAAAYYKLLLTELQSTAKAIAEWSYNLLKLKLFRVETIQVTIQLHTIQYNADLRLEPTEVGAKGKWRSNGLKLALSLWLHLTKAILPNCWYNWIRLRLTAALADSICSWLRL